MTGAYTAYSAAEESRMASAGRAPEVCRAGRDGTERPVVVMIVPEGTVKGGIATVTGLYRGSELERRYDLRYVESYRDGTKLQKLWKALGAYRQYRKILRQEKVALVHIHSSFGPSFYRKLPFIRWAKRRGIPVVNHIHGSALDDLYTHASERKKALVRKVYGQCDRILLLSPYWIEPFSEIVDPSALRVLPNAVQVHPERATKERMKARFEDPKLLFLGVLTRAKGTEVFAPVLRELRQAFPGIKLVAAGEGPEKAALVEAFGAPDLKGAIELPGWVRGEAKEKLLEEASLMFFPSHMESFGMTVLEALGSGLPVVSCNVGGIPALVDDHCAVLSEVDDAAAMSTAIREILKDRARYEAMSQAALARAAEKFSFTAHLEGLSEIYDEVIN